MCVCCLHFLWFFSFAFWFIFASLVMKTSVKCTSPKRKPSCLLCGIETVKRPVGTRPVGTLRLLGNPGTERKIVLKKKKYGGREPNPRYHLSKSIVPYLSKTPSSLRRAQRLCWSAPIRLCWSALICRWSFEESLLHRSRYGRKSGINWTNTPRWH